MLMFELQVKNSMLNTNDFVMNLEDTWPTIFPINNKQGFGILELPCKISLGGWENIHYGDQLYASQVFCWLSAFFQWPNKTHYMQSSFTRRGDHEETASSLKKTLFLKALTRNFSRQNVQSSELMSPGLPSTSGFPRQHPRDWPEVSRKPQAPLS